MPPNNGKVVTGRESRDYKRYQSLKTEIQAYHAQGVAAATKYWACIFEIYTKRLWYVEYPSQEDWVRSFSTEVFAPSRSQFFEVIGVYKALKGYKLTDNEVAFAVGTNLTAIVHDLKKAFTKQDGIYKLLPAVAAKLKEEGTTVRQLVMGMAANSGRTEARKRVGDIIGDRRVYCHESKWIGSTLLAKLVETGGDMDTVSTDVKVVCLQPPSELVMAFIENSITKERF